jgi:hypothetical protein
MFECAAGNGLKKLPWLKNKSPKPATHIKFKKLQHLHLAQHTSILNMNATEIDFMSIVSQGTSTTLKKITA